MGGSEELQGGYRGKALERCQAVVLRASGGGEVVRVGQLNEGKGQETGGQLETPNRTCR